MNEHTSISRRKWFERISIPAVVFAGAGLIANQALAAPGDKEDNEKMLGAATYNVKDYGAKGDGKTLDTIAIQAAIDACNKDNGGTVLIPGGDFVCGTIQLKSNVTLHLVTRGRLWGSPRAQDYQAGNGVPSGNGNIVFIYAVNAENISIEGKGSIQMNLFTF